MRRGAKGVSWGSAIALVLVLASPAVRAQVPGKGNLVGFIFGQDGSTPVSGAVVLVKNLTTGAVTEAAGPTSWACSKCCRAQPGALPLGVRSEAGSYNSQDFFGVTAEKIARSRSR
jgi:hypothetical protein